MARVIKAHPETQDLVSGEANEEKESGLVVSWESLEKRKAEFTDIVTNQIPQNLKDKKLAASYGDLRENFEYHAAKQKEAVLNRQRMDMEKELEQAQGTDFKDPDTSAVTIGTIATLEAGGKEKSYTILGAWDSIPEKNVVSYLSEVGRVLIGKKIGETVEVKDLETEKLESCIVKSIEAYNKG